MEQKIFARVLANFIVVVINALETTFPTLSMNEREREKILLEVSLRFIFPKIHLASVHGIKFKTFKI